MFCTSSRLVGLDLCGTSCLFCHKGKSKINDKTTVFQLILFSQIYIYKSNHYLIYPLKEIYIRTPFHIPFLHTSSSPTISLYPSHLGTNSLHIKFWSFLFVVLIIPTTFALSVFYPYSWNAYIFFLSYCFNPPPKGRLKLPTVRHGSRTADLAVKSRTLYRLDYGALWEPVLASHVLSTPQQQQTQEECIPCSLFPICTHGTRWKNQARTHVNKATCWRNGWRCRTWR